MTVTDTNYYKMGAPLDSCNFRISGRIWTNFFFKWARILPRVQLFCQLQDLVWNCLSNQKKGEHLPQMELSEQVNGIFGIL